MSNKNIRQEALSIVKDALHKLSSERGLTPRASQNKMISTIAQTLLDTNENKQNTGPGPNIVAIEAPTGTGKSFGYLLPAIPIAKKLNKKIVVSTAVVSLQEQLYNKDIPAIQKNMDMQFTYAIAKGRSRFVCAARLEKQKEAFEALGFKDDGSFSVGVSEEYTEDARVLMKMYTEFENGTWSGEQETLKDITETQKKTIWPKIITDNSGCAKKHCKSYKKCAYYLAKNVWMAADVVVANHDLVMSDLATPEGGVLLPEPSETVYIFDEAHHVPMKARDAFSDTFKVETFKKMPKEIASFLNGLATEWSTDKNMNVKVIGHSVDKMKPTYQDNIKKFMSDLDQFVIHISVMLKNNTAKEPYCLPYTKKELDGNKQIEDLMVYIKELVESAKTVSNIISDVYMMVVKGKKDVTKAGVTDDCPLTDDGEYTRVAGALGFYSKRFSNLINTLTIFSQEQPPIDNPPYAKWITPDEKNKDFVVSVAPTMATDILPTVLYERAYAVIYTSATMTSVGGFDLFKQKTGMIHYPNSRTLKLDSPFDFKKNATLVFGDMGVNPQDTENHTRRLIEALPVLLKDHASLGTLILFTSKAQMENVVQHLPFDIKSKCKVQYTLPNNILIAQHKNDVDSGVPSILIGTQSFSEGLDLPGAWCSLVISTKLPFSVPDNPIDKTLTSWLESKGRNVFKEVAVPEAAERLIQQSGRLLRREEDTGMIILLDNRIISKWYAYGKDLVEALPPFGRKKMDLSKVKYEYSAPINLPKKENNSVQSKVEVKIPEIYDEENEFKDFIF